MGFTFPSVVYGYTKHTSLFIKCEHCLISFRQECCVTLMATLKSETQGIELEFWDLYPKVLIYNYYSTPTTPQSVIS